MRILLKILALGALTVVLAGCLISLPGTGDSSTPTPSDQDMAEHVPNQILVRLIGETSAAAIAEAVGGSVLKELDGLARIKLPAGTSLSATVTALGKRADVAYAEPVYIYHTPVEGVARRITLRTGDYSGNQWGPQRIGAPGVWTQNPDCSSIRVGVVDTGIDTDNPELLERIVLGRNFVEENEAVDPLDYEDDEGHGTHVAGIIGAAHDDLGINGLAVGIKFVAAKVLGPDGGTNEWIAEGIRWAADPAQGNVDIINMSLGGWGRSQVLQEAVDYALAQGVIVVVSMGNGYRYGTSSYPAACEGVIAVGAANPDGSKADFSSEGPYISVAAPGVDILSCISGPEAYATWSGTSMAAPHVTGLVALLLSQASGRKPTMIRTLIEYYAGGTGWNKSLGWGVINVLAAYNNADGVADAYGGLQVTVAGSAVSNAEVLIRRASDNATVTAGRTGADGIVQFHYLKAGTYKVYVNKVTVSGTLSGSNENVIISGGAKGEVTITIL